MYCRFCTNHGVIGFKQSCKPNQNSRSTYKAMKQRDQLRHLSHLYTARKNPTNECCRNQCECQHSVATEFLISSSCNQCDQHACNTKEVPTAGGFRVSQPRQTENKQRSSNGVSNSRKGIGHHGPMKMVFNKVTKTNLPMKHRKHSASDQEPAGDIDRGNENRNCTENRDCVCGSTR